MGRGCHVSGAGVEEQLRHRRGSGEHEMRLGQEVPGGENYLSEEKFLDLWSGLLGINVLRSVLHSVRANKDGVNFPSNI